jgi:predicted phosphoribosyltransferase
LEHLRGTADLLVLALPRGGVPVAEPIARRLGAPLDAFIVRKIGFPGQEEFAMGAVASGGVTVLNPGITEQVSGKAFNLALERALRELEEREQRYRAGRPPARIAGRTVVLIDDGLATGASMQAAIEAVQRQQPRSLVAAVPIAAPDTCERLRTHVDEMICAATPELFRAVGLWYEDFSPPSDDEVRAALGMHPAGGTARGAAPGECGAVRPSGSGGRQLL